MVTAAAAAAATVVGRAVIQAGDSASSSCSNPRHDALRRLQRLQLRRRQKKWAACSHRPDTN